MHLIWWLTQTSRREYFSRRAFCGIIAAFGLFFVTSALAQDPPELHWPSDRPALSTETAGASLQLLARENYLVVAIMVEFQPDDSRFTTGDGTFDGDLFGGLEPRVDPLPHNADYFEARLRFLSNYVERVSGGRTAVDTWLHPEPIRLPRQMGEYSPTGPEAASDAELARLAQLVHDAWSSVEPPAVLNDPAIDPDEVVFVIFHAGVGRDIELIGTTLDKTPEDIPSLYFGPSALNRLLPSLPTLGNLTVDHSLILPRTETRRGQNFITGEPFLAEFSINGMLAATFFSRLGVPDLFNTETGASGIGPFGLMDPLGIFAFNGLFPPEPSAWTKHFLGWAETRVHRAGSSAELSLRAASAPGPSDQLRLPISDAEYFLLENRYRGLDGGGVTLTVWRDGEESEVRFTNYDGEFSRFNIDAFAGGVVTNASNFDWALPGGLDEDGNELNGGMLIWHVDERIIASGLAQNRVNVDPRRRGVSLREADGAQDIGFPAVSDFGPQAHLGTPFDFYFEGNPVRVVTRTGREMRFYENRFGPDTVPSSHTTDGGPSFIVVDAFSLPGEFMSIEVYRAEESGMTSHGTLSGIVLPQEAGEGSSVLSTTTGTERFVYLTNDGGGGIVAAIDTTTGDVRTAHQNVTARPARYPDGSLVVPQSVDGSLRLLVGQTVVDIDGPSTSTPPLVLGDRLFIADGRGRLWTIDGEFSATCLICEDGATTALASSGIGIYFAADSRLRAMATNGAIVQEWDLGPGFRPDQMVMADSPTGTSIAVIDRQSATLAFIRGSDVRWIDTQLASLENAHIVPIHSAESPGARFLVASGDVVTAYEASGAVVAGFPYRTSDPVSAQPLVLEVDGTLVVLLPLASGRIDAVEIGARRVGQRQGFPLSIGSSLHATPSVGDGLLTSVSGDGVMQAFRLTSEVNVLYGEAFGDTVNSSYLVSTSNAPPAPETRSIIREETYNWPNPIRDGSTNIRVTTSAPAEVEVHVVDGIGQSLGRMELGSVSANVPTEARFTSDLPNGIYFARVRASFVDGGEETYVIKMAVLK